MTPLDADELCRELFAATQRLGRPDPLLARELADSVHHFWALDPQPLSSQDRLDFVTRIVRELGQPTLAHILTEWQSHQSSPASASPPSWPIGWPQTSALSVERWAARQRIAEYNLTHVYGPDVTAAHEAGWLAVQGLGTLAELLVGLAGPFPGGNGLLIALSEARDLIGEQILIDGPEYTLEPLAGSAEELALDWLRQMAEAATTVGVSAIVNVNVPPPAWAVGSSGPLFETPSADRGRIADLALALAVHAAPPVEIAWHFGERDLRGELAVRMRAVVEAACRGQPIRFIPDSSRGVTRLSPWADRRSPDVLAVVELRLLQLADEGLASFSDRAIRLTRLALAAGRSRREFLRHNARPALLGQFRLERAKLVIIPNGLPEAVLELIGEPLAASGPSLEFARELLRRLRTVCEEGTSSGLETILDLPAMPQLADASFAVTESLSGGRLELAGDSTEVWGGLRRSLSVPGAVWLTCSPSYCRTREPA